MTPGFGPPAELRCLPDTSELDLDELHDSMLSRAGTPEERVLGMLRRLRWEARELDRRPLPIRMELMNVFEPAWERLASRFAAPGFRPPRRPCGRSSRQYGCDCERS